MNRFFYLVFFVASLFFAEVGWAEHQNTDGPVGNNDQGTLTNGSVIRLPSARGADGDAGDGTATAKPTTARKTFSEDGRTRTVKTYAQTYGEQPKFQLPAFGAPLPSVLTNPKPTEKKTADRQPASNGISDASFAAAVAGLSAAAAADRNILALAPAVALTSGQLPPSPGGGGGGGSGSTGSGGGGGGGGGAAQGTATPTPTASPSPTPTKEAGGGKGGAGAGGSGGGGGKGSGEGTATATGGATTGTATGNGGPPGTPPKAPPGGTGVVPPSSVQKPTDPKNPATPPAGEKPKGGPATVAPPAIPAEKRQALVNEMGMTQVEADAFFKTDEGAAALKAYASNNVKDFQQAMTDAACTVSVGNQELGEKLRVRSDALEKGAGEYKSVSEALKATRPKDETPAPADPAQATIAKIPADK